MEPDLTAAEVAAELRLHLVTVQRMARRGDIAAYKAGRGKTSGYRFTRSAVNAYKAAQRTASWRNAG